MKWDSKYRFWHEILGAFLKSMSVSLYLSRVATIVPVPHGSQGGKLIKLKFMKMKVWSTIRCMCGEKETYHLAQLCFLLLT